MNNTTTPAPTEPEPNLSPRVFISHASQDAAVAEGLRAALEAVQLRCWIAPRDVRAGDSYAAAIVQAINSCPVMLVVFSKSATASSHVLREVERASSKGHRVISVRLDDAPLPPDFEYFLSANHWLDASNGRLDQIIPALIASVQNRSTDNPAAPTPPSSARLVPRGIAIAFSLALLAVICIAAGKLWWSKHVTASELSAQPSAQSSAQPTTHANSKTVEKSVAVMPFLDMSEKKDQEYFGVGIAEEISALLAKIPQIKMIGRASSMQFKDRTEDPRALGEKLDAAYLVEGSVRKAGNTIRVTAQLIDTRSTVQLWADSFDGNYDGVLDLQKQIASGIARALQLVVESEEVAHSRPLQSPEAYTLYLRGLSELDQMHQSSLFDAQSNFEHALELDPSFLRAAEALSETYVEQAFDESLPPRTAWRKARDVANQALALDANSAAAHGVLGIVYAANDFQWDAAEAEFAKALALQPRDPRTLRLAALVTHARGRQEEALRRGPHPFRWTVSNLSFRP